MNIKGMGYFVMGLLHIKIPLSYNHIYELINENSKSFSSSIMTLVEISTTGWIGLSLQYLTKDLVDIMLYINIIQTIGVFLYFLVVPESPRWLFLNGKNEQAIDVLNYISRFNGSSYKLAKGTQLDILGQALN